MPKLKRRSGAVGEPQRTVAAVGDLAGVLHLHAARLPDAPLPEELFRLHRPGLGFLAAARFRRARAHGREVHPPLDAGGFLGHRRDVARDRLDDHGVERLRARRASSEGVGAT